MPHLAFLLLPEEALMNFTTRREKRLFTLGTYIAKQYSKMLVRGKGLRTLKTITHKQCMKPFKENLIFIVEELESQGRIPVGLITKSILDNASGVKIWSALRQLSDVLVSNKLEECGISCANS